MSRPLRFRREGRRLLILTEDGDEVGFVEVPEGATMVDAMAFVEHLKRVLAQIAVGPN